MGKDSLYKVLWVEDEIERYEMQVPIVAEEFGLDMDLVSNWEDAKFKLESDFDSYSAIILDAMCKLTPDGVPVEYFTYNAVADLVELFAKRDKSIPWYILSAGTMSNFDRVIEFARYRQMEHEEEWGPLVYMKDVPSYNPQNSDNLFAKIAEVAKNQSINVVLVRHKGVFTYLGSDKLMRKEARDIMLKMLSALYFPMESRYFVYEGNPLRKVLEYMFRSANEIGLLPIECIERDGQINLLESCRYMSGMTTKYGGLHFGNPGIKSDGSGGDTIFPKQLGDMIRSILEFGNVDSHTNEVNPYTIDDENLTLTEDEKELFFGYVLQLCHIIKFYGRYATIHSDVDKNKAMKKVVAIVDMEEHEENAEMIKLKGKTGIIERDRRGLRIGKCRINSKLFDKYIGKQATIIEVSINNSTNDDECPYWGTKIEII